MPYVTVYGMVQEVVRGRPGDRVVVTAAANSIGLAAVRRCSTRARRPCSSTTGTSPRPCATPPEQARNSSSTRWAGPGWRSSCAPGAPGATVIVHGGLSGQPTPLPGGRNAPVWMRRYIVFEITGDPAALRRAEHFVRAGLACGAFTPSVDRVFDFDDVAAAHTYVDSPTGRPASRCCGSGRADRTAAVLRR